MSDVSVQDIIRSVRDGDELLTPEEQMVRGSWWKERQQLACTRRRYNPFLVRNDVIEAWRCERMRSSEPLLAVGVYYPARKAIIALINLVATSIF